MGEVNVDVTPSLCKMTATGVLVAFSSEVQDEQCDCQQGKEEDCDLTVGEDSWGVGLIQLSTPIKRQTNIKVK